MSAEQAVPIPLAVSQMAARVSHLRRDLPLVGLDLVSIFFAYLAPLVLRFDGEIPRSQWRSFLTLLLIAGSAHLIGNRVFGLYGQMWRYAGVHEARRVVIAGGAAVIVVVAAGTRVGGVEGRIPLSALAIGGALALLTTGGVRFQSRLFAFRRRTQASESTIRVLMIGAGDAASTLLKDLFANPGLGPEPVAIIDDDPKKVGRSLHGVPILGPRAAIPELVARLGVRQVLLTVPSATKEMVQHVAALCEEADVPLRVLPSIRELTGGKVSVRDIRELRIEDLLGRTTVGLDRGSVGHMITGRHVLVTGAGGSIGSEIVAQVASFEPATLVLVDHDETHLYEAAGDLPASVSSEQVLADVRDREKMAFVFTRYRPEVVFHAAAHKHVPILEDHPAEALLTNITGTANVADAALASGVKRFVLISTDKAINPSSVMGASKWFAEQMVLSLPSDRCVFCAVRFGNVLGSRGSVVPTFLKQIARGGPVTVTDPSMSRYFMTIGEAVELVLQAAASAEGGEVFTLEMGNPVNILEIARKLIRLSGHTPDRDIAIEIVGPRPGEKIHEEAVAIEEERIPSGHPDIWVSLPAEPDRRALRAAVGKLEKLAAEGSRNQLAAEIKTMALSALRSAEEVRSA